jgi:hypothetical protein
LWRFVLELGKDGGNLGQESLDIIGSYMLDFMEVLASSGVAGSTSMKVEAIFLVKAKESKSIRHF